MMKMISSPHFSEQYKDEMISKYKSSATGGLEQTHVEGKQLIDAFRKMMEMEKLPSDSEVQPLAKRWIHEVESIVPDELQPEVTSILGCLIKHARNITRTNPRLFLKYVVQAAIHPIVH